MSTAFASHSAHDAPTAHSNSTTSFELTAEQQRIVGDLGHKMRFVGGFFMLMAGLRLLSDVLVADAYHFDQSLLVDVLLGLWTISAGRAFQQAGRTQRRDFEYIIEGLSHLRKLYLLIFWLLAAATVVAAGFLLFGLVK